MTSAFETVVLVDFAQQAFGSVRTGTVKRVDLVVTRSSVVTRIVGAVVNVKLTLRPLEAGQTVAGVVAALIDAASSVSAFEIKVD